MNPIQWYPGHIAKAEKQLKEQLKRVDVVLEVRDARIPLATHHPQLSGWIGEKSRVLILNRIDSILPEVRQGWEEWFAKRGETAHFTNGQQGTGIDEVAKAARATGEAVNRRRKERGMLPRPVRAVVIGFPNVGKSAIINRLLKRRVVKSARFPGVTRQLRWVRMSDELELLDSPGILPWRLDNRDDGVKLAICDDIGEAAYDNQRVAHAFIELVVDLDAIAPECIPIKLWRSRYKIDPKSMTGESYLHELSNRRHKGDVERTARQILSDYRRGFLGPLPLELPPM